MAAEQTTSGREFSAHNAVAAESSEETVREIDVSRVRPNRYQPRREFDEESLAELVESVRAYGVLQPVLVRRINADDYELVAGERRLRAAKAAGLKTVPAVVREYNDAVMSEVALIENIQRENLNVIEEAAAYERLLAEFHLTQEQIAQRIGRSRSHIANILRLLKLAPKVQEFVAKGVLSMGQAKPLLALSGEQQEQAAQVIVDKGLSARQAEALAKKMLKNRPVPESRIDSDRYFRDAEERLTHIFGARVRISSGKTKNSLRVDFYSADELAGLVERLTESLADGKKRTALPQSRSLREFTV